MLGCLRFWDWGLGGKLLLGKRRVSQVGRKHFRFGQAKYRYVLCIKVEAAKQLIIHAKQLIISALNSSHPPSPFPPPTSSPSAFLFFSSHSHCHPPIHFFLFSLSFPFHFLLLLLTPPSWKRDPQTDTPPSGEKAMSLQLPSPVSASQSKTTKMHYCYHIAAIFCMRETFLFWGVINHAIWLVKTAIGQSNSLTKVDVWSLNARGATTGIFDQPGSFSMVEIHCSPILGALRSPVSHAFWLCSLELAENELWPHCVGPPLHADTHTHTHTHMHMHILPPPHTHTSTFIKGPPQAVC